MNSKRLYVPDLDEKFALLRAWSDNTTPQSLACALGVSPKTLRWWVTGDATRPPEHIPVAKLAPFTALFVALLSGLDPALVHRLVMGSARLLREALETQGAVLLTRIIARDALRDQGRIVRRSAELGLVEVETEIPNAIPTLKTGEWFRIEYPARHNFPYAIVLQTVGQSWGLLPVKRLDSKRLLVPGLRPDSTTAYMRERAQRGLHRFVCFQSAQPFPALIREHADEGIVLDKRALETLATFYAGLSSTARVCQLVECVVEDDATS